jgi:phosphoglycolate phosphatase-like HAD superfamily hydrolase
MRAVIFDLDGTLLDVSESIFWQYETLTREFNGVRASREAIAAALKSTSDEAVRQLVTNLRVPFAQVQQRHDQLRVSSLKHLRLYPHVNELLPILHRLGIRIAVLATDSTDTSPHMQRLGLLPYVHTIVLPAHLPKDDARINAVHIALDKLDVLPHEAIVVGDLPQDIIAAKQVAVDGAVGITHGFGSAHDLREAGADHIVHDIPSLLDIVG